MCGRYTLTTSAAELAKHFWLEREPRLGARYNIAPSQPVCTVMEDRDQGGPPQCRLMHWGLVPHWAKDTAIANRLINARSETAAAKPAFRAAMRYRRCLIPANGFYEWQRTGTRKQPHLIAMADRSLFAMAGLWEHWQSENGDELESCVVLTTEPNELMAPIHNRMPVILARDDYRAWLDPTQTDASQVLPLLRPAPAETMAAIKVGTVVNNPRNDTPACAEPVVSDGGLFDNT